MFHFPEKQGWIWVTFDYIAVRVSISLNSLITIEEEEEGGGRLVGVSKQGYHPLEKNKQINNDIFFFQRESKAEQHDTLANQQPMR